MTSYYHGRNADDTHSAQIGACYTDDPYAAAQYAVMSGGEGQVTGITLGAGLRIVDVDVDVSDIDEGIYPDVDADVIRFADSVPGRPDIQMTAIMLMTDLAVESVATFFTSPISDDLAVLAGDEPYDDDDDDWDWD